MFENHLLSLLHKVLNTHGNCSSVFVANPFEHTPKTFLMGIITIYTTNDDNVDLKVHHYLQLSKYF